MMPQIEKPALKGKRIVVTRARSQAGVLARRIRDLGGEAIEFPTIEIKPLHSYAALDGAIQELRRYDWLFFTSVNGVEHFLNRLRHLKKEVGEMEGLKVVAIGPETARRLGDAGIRPCLVPKQYQAEGILEGLTPAAIRGKRVLIPRAAQAREILPETLREWGGEVEVIEAYRTSRPSADTSPLRRMFSAGEIDMVTFTSSSTVSNFARMFPDDNVSELVGRARIACIGPITSKTLDELGLRTDVVSEEFTIPGLVRAIIAYFSPDR
ncbi:MAG: uroporphyrinogen-III synthase, partial [Candidatus Binatia bacterium]